MLLEVCVDSVAGIEAALAGGADRIELCSALGVGGLTPSPGLMAVAAKAPVPVYAMIRPSEGDYVFPAADVEAMLADIRAARAAGLAGVVLGAAQPDGTLDIDVLGQLRREAEGLGTTLNRVFDLVPDPMAALEAAIRLGFERILTSGQAQGAPEGTAIIAALQRAAAGRIVVMAGAGLAPANVGALVRLTGVTEVHGSCSGPRPPARERVRRFGFEPREPRMTDAERVRAMKAAAIAAAGAD